MSIRNRILLLAGAILLAVTLATAAVVDHRLRADARSRAAGELEAAVETARQLEAERTERLVLQAELLGEVLPLADALRAGDRRAIAELAEDLAARPRTADLVAVFGADGSLLATSGRSASAAERLRGSGGIAAIDGRIWSYLRHPVEEPTSGAVLGWVLVAEQVGPRAAENLARLTSSEVVLLNGGSPVASTLPLGSASQVARQVPELVSGAGAEIRLHGESYLARIETLGQTAAGEPGAERLFLSRMSSGLFPAGLTGQVMLVGAAGILVALPLLWWGGHRLNRSLSDLSDVMAETAATGRLENEPAIEDDLWASPEVKRLKGSFRSLMRTVEMSLRDRERSYVEAVGAVVAAIDARDHETTGHSFRVAHYALALARQLGIEDERLRAIEWGALLHDVGKIAIPDAILRKTGRLTEEEWHVMRQHPNWGFEMLADVKFLGPALEIVYSHHERWDGGGYPRGLEREEIPLTARIFAVVDTYDSITSDRPYRRARSHAEAITELCRVAGTQLDPDVVEAFIRLPEVMLRSLRERSERLDLKVRIPDAMTELPSTEATGAGHGA